MNGKASGKKELCFRFGLSSRMTQIMCKEIEARMDRYACMEQASDLHSKAAV